MSNVLIYADTFRSPELRHELPIGVPDPFLYAEVDGTRHVVVSQMEIPRLAELGLGLELHPPEELGVDELIEEGLAREEIVCRLAVRFCERFGVNEAEVPDEFPLRLADALRAAAVALHPRGETFDERRRVKSDAELAGIRRAQYAADSAMAAAAGLIRLDIWPRDNESACYADMTRTFVVGDPPAELVEWHALVKEALDASFAELRPGVRCRAVYDRACDIVEAAGLPTQRTKEHGKPLEEGFFHSLGHGVGLEIHEAPILGMLDQHELVPGDVVTLEPGIYRPGFGGCRLEDLALVTEDGAENLTRFPYDLKP